MTSASISYDYTKSFFLSRALLVLFFGLLALPSLLSLGDIRAVDILILFFCGIIWIITFKSIRSTHRPILSSENLTLKCVSVHDLFNESKRSLFPRGDVVSFALSDINVLFDTWDNISTTIDVFSGDVASERLVTPFGYKEVMAVALKNSGEVYIFEEFQNLKDPYIFSMNVRNAIRDATNGV